MNGLKYGVIDIGSNSVRLMIWQNGVTLNKYSIITKLAQGLGEERVLKRESVERTAQAIFEFYQKGKELGADVIYSYATEAVRLATNKEVLLNAVKDKIGLEIEVLDGDQEAKLGSLGALNGKDGGIIDIGGASTEINVVESGNTVYSKSVGLGSVKIYDVNGDNLDKRNAYISSKVDEFGAVPNANFFAIGGTATTVASMLLELERYDMTKTHGFVVAMETVENLSAKLDGLSLEERLKLKGLQPQRANVIPGGVALLSKIMQRFNIKEVTVSENDNLEGYILNKLKGGDIDV